MVRELLWANAAYRVYHRRLFIMSYSLMPVKAKVAVKKFIQTGFYEVQK